LSFSFQYLPEKKIEVLGNLDHHNTNITLVTFIKQKIAIFRLKITKTVSLIHHVIERSSSLSQKKKLAGFCSRV
jgi:hypothetical protein